MKNYIKPIFEIIELNVQDVVTVSDFYIDDPDWFV